MKKTITTIVIIVIAIYFIGNTLPNLIGIPLAAYESHKAWRATHQRKKDIDSKVQVAINTVNEIVQERKLIDTSGTKLHTRILPPANFKRTEEHITSFGQYLRTLPLKPHDAEVLLYNGSIKPNYNVYDAVIDMEIGKKNLHQCADAVMRFRAEYLWEQKRYNDIHFNFTNGFNVAYSEWMKGRRIVVKGNKVHWINKTTASNTYKDFWKYMELIFSYAGTLSLSKELVAVEIKDLTIGDVFIWGGSPGHAVLVVDTAINPDTRETIFLLAQSYMPAQETQILKNPNNPNLSPWYATSEIKDELKTPEWDFSSKDLKRFKK